MSGPQRSIVAATCPRCNGALELDENHERFFECPSCRTSLEDVEFGRGRPTEITVTVVHRAEQQTVSRRLLVILGVTFAVLIVALVIVGVVESSGDDDGGDRISLGASIGSGDDLEVVATGLSFDGEARAVYAALGSDDGARWSVGVGGNPSVQPRTAIGDDVVYVLVERRLIGLDKSDGERLFELDLAADLACPECLLVTGAERRFVTVVLLDGAMQSYDRDGELVTETTVASGFPSVVASGDRVVALAQGRGAVVVAPADDLDAAVTVDVGCAEADADDRPSLDVVDDVVVYSTRRCIARVDADAASAEVLVSDRHVVVNDFGRPEPGLLHDGASIDLVDVTDGSVVPTTFDGVNVRVIGRGDDVVTVVARNQGGAWAIAGVDADTGAQRWTKTPPGTFTPEFRVGILQHLGNTTDDVVWLAGASGSSVHVVSNNVDADVLTVARYDAATGDEVGRHEIAYADEGDTGVRYPVVLGFTDVGVVVTLDDRIGHVDTATGEVLAEF